MKKNLLITICTILCLITKVNAQLTYCEPIFLNGCFGWNNKEISLDTMNWILGSTDCQVSDYTSMQATVTKGVATPMTVLNGSWCGVGVWVDFNSDGDFDSTENLYNQYTAGDPQTYSFLIVVPNTVPDGVYRMRVIAGWGTDCYSTSSTNGYGACGAYQYGNFDDFSLNVIDASVGIADPGTENKLFSVYPNPASDILHVNVNSTQVGELFFVSDELGKNVITGKFDQENSSIDISKLSKGIYILSSGISRQMFKVIK